MDCGQTRPDDPDLLQIGMTSAHASPNSRQSSSASKPVEGAAGGVRSLLTSLSVRVAEGQNPRPMMAAPLRCMAGARTLLSTLVQQEK